MAANQNTGEAGKTKKVKGLRVITKKDGFRRAGREWHGTTEVPVTEFEKEQIEQLKAEDGRMLVVQECQITVPAEEESKTA